MLFNTNNTVTGSALNDGQWHSVDLSVRRGRLILAVDKSDMSTVTISFPVMPANQIFLGGTVNLTPASFFSRSLVVKVGSGTSKGKSSHL